MDFSQLWQMLQTLELFEVSVIVTIVLFVTKELIEINNRRKEHKRLQKALCFILTKELNGIFNSLCTITDIADFFKDSNKMMVILDDEELIKNSSKMKFKTLIKINNDGLLVFHLYTPIEIYQTWQAETKTYDEQLIDMVTLPDKVYDTIQEAYRQVDVLEKFMRSLSNHIRREDKEKVFEIMTTIRANGTKIKESFLDAIDAIENLSIRKFEPSYYRDEVRSMREFFRERKVLRKKIEAKIIASGKFNDHPSKDLLIENQVNLELQHISEKDFLKMREESAKVTEKLKKMLE